MIILLLSFILQLNEFKEASGVKFKDGSLYLTGGLKGGYLIYNIPLSKGTMNIKMKLKMKNLTSSMIGIYIKNYGNLKSLVLPPLLAKIDSSYYLWEGTKNNEWSSSRPEFLNLYQGKDLRFINEGKIEILLYAGGGFFKRGRFLINEIEVIEKGLSDDMLKKIEENGLKVEDNLITAEVFFPYQRATNDTQRKALALRGAKLKAEKMILDVINTIGIKQQGQFQIINVQYIENGVNIKIGLILNF